MRDFPATFFATFNLAAKLLECFDKEALYVMWLKPLCFRSLHLNAQLVNSCLGHGVICQRPALKKLQQVVLVDGPVHYIEELGLDVLLLSILDRFEK